METSNKSTEPIIPNVSSPAGKKSHPLAVIIIILVSIIALFLVAKYLVPNALVYLTRAAKPTNYSLSNSYVFGSPLVVPADGKTKARVNAFLLDNQGMGVADKQLVLKALPKEKSAAGNVQVADVQPVTDKFGKATFEIVSSFTGQFAVTALVDGVEFPQSVTVTFR